MLEIYISNESIKDASGGNMTKVDKRKKYNKYDLSGEFGIGFTSNTNKAFYFDLEDYDKIKDYCWSENQNKKSGYTFVEAWDKDIQNVVRMHWIIIGKNCDHIDRDPMNNRKSNLRVATRQENNRNCSISKNNTSGIIGVAWVAKKHRWIAYVGMDYKRITLGSFENKEDAIRARLEGERKYFGEFAPQKHLFEQYGIE